MHKTTTLKDFNVFLLKACLTTLILGFSFSVSFAQKQSANVAKPTSDEKRKQMRAASNANASATFSDAVKNESALKATPSSVAATPTADASNASTQSVETKKAQMKAAGKNAPANATPAPTKTAAEIEKKKSGQNATGTGKADRFLKAKGN